MNYTINLEDYGFKPEVYKELEPLYRQHYFEMVERLRGEGVEYGPYNPRLDEYDKASKGGWLLTFIVRTEIGTAIGYCNLYITNDMHNQDLIAQEDTIYIVPEHRNGIGRKLMKFALEELKRRGVKRFLASAMTDLRATKMWQRMGFKELATQMIYRF
jgi:ribosomal protein S18 acetylase RimI-like enzyme